MHSNRVKLTMIGLTGLVHGFILTSLIEIGHGQEDTYFGRAVAGGTAGATLGIASGRIKHIIPYSMSLGLCSVAIKLFMDDYQLCLRHDRRNIEINRAIFRQIYPEKFK